MLKMVSINHQLTRAWGKTKEWETSEQKRVKEIFIASQSIQT